MSVDADSNPDPDPDPNPDPTNTVCDSWDRLPFVTDVREPGTPSTTPQWNDVARNLIVANYAADGGCVDNDDGSQFYRIHHNFCVFGGHKGDFDGHSKLSYQNVHAFPVVYKPSCLNIGVQALPPAGFADGYYANRCVLSSGAEYLTINGGLQGDLPCLADNAASFAAFTHGLRLGNNSVYVPGGVATVSCGGLPGNPNRVTINSTEFQRLGYDLSTAFIGEMPSNSTIIAWARELLSMPPAS